MPIHAAVLAVDRGTTLEIVIQPDRTLPDLHRAALPAYLDELPEGLICGWPVRWPCRGPKGGQSISGPDSGSLEQDLLELYAQPLRDAPRICRSLIEDFHINPGRIRLAWDGGRRSNRYIKTRWSRAQMLALLRLSRQRASSLRRLRHALRGPAAESAAHRARARALAERTFAVHGRGTVPRSYALIWVRDDRTWPQVFLQVVELLHATDPRRQILLVGHDLFAEHPRLRTIWAEAGALDYVDTHRGQVLAAGASRRDWPHVGRARVVLPPPTTPAARAGDRIRTRTARAACGSVDADSVLSSPRA